eukprot:359206-Chlamydomonas_euryale.AAC.3
MIGVRAFWLWRNVDAGQTHLMVCVRGRQDVHICGHSTTPLTLAWFILCTNAIMMCIGKGSYFVPTCLQASQRQALPPPQQHRIASPRAQPWLQLEQQQQPPGVTATGTTSQPHCQLHAEYARAAPMHLQMHAHAAAAATQTHPEDQMPDVTGHLSYGQRTAVTRAAATAAAATAASAVATACGMAATPLQTEQVHLLASPCSLVAPSCVTQQARASS